MPHSPWAMATLIIPGSSARWNPSRDQQLKAHSRDLIFAGVEAPGALTLPRGTYHATRSIAQGALWRRLFPQVQSAKGRLGPRLRYCRRGWSKRLPPLVHVVGHRTSAGLL